VDVSGAKVRFSDARNPERPWAPPGSVRPWGEGNIDADPRFIDPLAGDFRLRSDSPCIDRAPPGLVAADFEGETRPQGAAADMGADEVYCSYGISSANVRAPAKGRSGIVTVSAPPGCVWTAVSSTPWIRVRAGSSGVGSGTVSYQVRRNLSGRLRRGRLKIGGLVFAVKQVR